MGEKRLDMKNASKQMPTLAEELRKGHDIEAGFRTCMGPGELKKCWISLLKEFEIDVRKAVNYWSPSSYNGVLDLEIASGNHLAVFWIIGNENTLIYWRVVEKVDLSEAIEGLSSTYIMSGVIRLLSEKY
ncbi:MAG: hypothetical protein DRN20_00235 [Thermoplasmata archaeon]|nr:MAG: hypothetical protein DRN20_00235 [Thermoplasmata archaeon]